MGGMCSSLGGSNPISPAKLDELSEKANGHKAIHEFPQNFKKERAEVVREIAALKNDDDSIEVGGVKLTKKSTDDEINNAIVLKLVSDDVKDEISEDLFGVVKPEIDEIENSVVRSSSEAAAKASIKKVVDKAVNLALKKALESEKAE